MPLCPHTHAPGTGGCRGFRPQHGLFLPQRGTCGQLHRIPLPAHRRGCLRAAKPDFRHTGQSPLFRLGIPAHPARRGDAARRPVLPAVAAAVHGYLRREPLYPLQQQAQCLALRLGRKTTFAGIAHSPGTGCRRGARHGGGHRTNPAGRRGRTPQPRGRDAGRLRKRAGRHRMAFHRAGQSRLQYRGDPLPALYRQHHGPARCDPRHVPLHRGDRCRNLRRTPAQRNPDLPPAVRRRWCSTP